MDFWKIEHHNLFYAFYTSISYMGSGLGCVQGWGQKGGLGGLPTHQVVLCAGAYTVPCFCSGLFRRGVWVFGFFCIFYVQVYTESYSETHSAKYKFCGFCFPSRKVIIKYFAYLMYTFL